MSNSTWPEGAMEDAIELAKIGVMPMKILQFLKSKFTSYEFKHDAVKSFVYRWKQRGNIAPRAVKWNQEVSQRAIALVREGKGQTKVAEILTTEFPQYKFYKNDVCNHIYKVRRDTGDNTLKFAGKPTADINIKNNIKNLVETTSMSSQQIADELGITRGVVCGLIFRMRKELGDTFKAKGKSPEWKRSPKISPVQTRNGGSVVKAITAAAKRNHRKVEAQTMMRGAIVCCEQPKLIWDLVWCDCRWIITEDTPINDTFYCANVIEPNSSYCAAHSKMAHDGRLPGAGFVKRPGIAPNWMTIRHGRAA